jgi:hypothetical protein
MTKVITSVRVDDELWKKAKIHAIEKNETLTDMLERLLKEELERKQKEGTPC